MFPQVGELLRNPAHAGCAVALQLVYLFQARTHECRNVGESVNRRRVEGGRGVVFMRVARNLKFPESKERSLEAVSHIFATYFKRHILYKSLSCHGIVILHMTSHLTAQKSNHIYLQLNQLRHQYWKQIT